VRLREATKADLQPLSILASRTFLETYDDLSAEEANAYVNQFFSELAFAEHFDSRDSQIFVAEEDRLVGYVLLCVNALPLSLARSPSIECVRLFLDRAVQGKMLGIQLLNKALYWATEAGYRSTWLKVWDQNVGAIAFYERNGFSRVGVTPYTEGGMDDLVLIMERTLAVEDDTGI
jgi:GNAT superfamily N-acetyltransferase